jgi:hypothetical protein
MKIKFALPVLFAAFSFNAIGQTNNNSIATYTQAKAPLRQSPYKTRRLAARDAGPPKNRGYRQFG